MTVDCVDLIPHSGLVYDCVDRHSAYGGLMNPALVDAMELELAAKTDMTFATAKSLAERLQKAQPEAKFIPNGANFERFFEATKPQPVPEDMKDSLLAAHTTLLHIEQGGIVELTNSTTVRTLHIIGINL